MALGDSEAIALSDCDILTYDKNYNARLVYPVANPRFNFDFCKGYYPRVSKTKVRGRVARLLVTPLLRALEKQLGLKNIFHLLIPLDIHLLVSFHSEEECLKI